MAQGHCPAARGMGKGGERRDADTEAVLAIGSICMHILSNALPIQVAARVAGDLERSISVVKGVRATGCLGPV